MNPVIWRIAFAAAAVLALSGAGAQTELRDVTVSGSGSTREAARHAALVAAVEQTFGLRVSASGTVKSSSEETVEKLDASMRSKASVSDRGSQDISVATRGVVTRYSVLREARDTGSGLWESELKVTCSVQAANSRELRSVVLFPFTASIAGEVSMAQSLTLLFTSELVQSRRFRIVDAEKSGLVESNIPTSSESLSGGNADLSLARSADYFVAGSLDRTESPPGFSLHARVIDAGSRQVKWSESVFIPASTEGGAVSQSAQAQAASELASSVLEAIYPVKVLVAQANGEVVVNQGGRRLRVGQRFKCYIDPKIVADPDSDRPVRVDSVQAASLAITDVFPKYSIATVIEGAADRLNPGDVCRPFTEADQAAFEERDRQRRAAALAAEMASGRAPTLTARTFRTAGSWQLSIENRGPAAVRVSSLMKHIAGATTEAAVGVLINPHDRYDVGLSDPFHPGDAIDIRCEGFEAPFVHEIR
jgi:hypothetical protein